VFLPTVLISGTSIFGFGPQLPGEIQSQYSTAALGRGGFEMAIKDSMGLNQSNFALWSILSRTTISLNLRFQGISTKTNYDKIGSLNANFQGGFVGIPLIKRKMAIGFGLIPQLENDFKVKIQDVGIGTSAEQNIRVSGNIGEAKFIFSYAFIPSLSFALIPSYSFGFVSDKTSILYDDFAYGNIYVENRFKVYGPGLTLSAFSALSPRLAVGATIKFPQKLSLNTEQVSTNKSEIIDEDREATLPLETKVGISYRLSKRWQTGIDFQYYNWKGGYMINNRLIRGLTNNYRIGVGIERVPEDKQIAPLSEEMTYRGGFFFGQIYRNVNYEPVYDYGISLGLGFPIIRNRNRLDFAFEYGQRGDLSINLVTESYFRFHVSISANELWFVRENR
jgi:hypothetical protein